MDALPREDIQCQVGDEVFSADDHKIGKVVAYDARYLTVEHGLLHKEQYFIPMGAVNSCANHEIYLTVDQDAIEAQGWDAPPLLSTEADGGVRPSG